MAYAKDIYGGWGPKDVSKAKRAELAKQMFHLISDSDPNCIPFKIKGKKTAAPPKVMLYEATRKVYGKDTPNYAQQHGSCFPAGTPVRMGDGSEKSIEDVKVGDEVVTHTGNIRQVVDTMRRKFTGKMVTISSRSFPYPLTLTEDHPVAIATSQQKWRWIPNNFKWIDAKDLTTDDHYIIGRLPTSKQFMIDVMDVIGHDVIVENHNLIRLNKLCKTKNSMYRHIPINADFGRFIGLYLAEGHLDNAKVGFTFNITETDYVDEVVSLTKTLFGIDATARSRPNKNTIDVTIPGATLVAFIRGIIPGNVYTKRVPSCIMSATNEVKEACILGWIDGDGYRNISHQKNRKSLKIALKGTSVSQHLTRDMASIAVTLNIPVTVGRRKGHSKETSNYKTNASPAYIAYFSGKQAYEKLGRINDVNTYLPRATVNRSRILPLGYATDIDSISYTSVENLDVYDFEVEEDHSFVANGIIVHNCVGMTAKNCTEYMQACEILLGDRDEFKLIHQPYVYAAGRRQAGYRSKGDGCYGSASVQGVSKYGTIPADTQGVPTFAQAEYDWSGPDRGGSWAFEKYLDIGQKHQITKYSQITNWEDYCDAIANGYLVQVCSNRGFNMDASSDGFHAPRGSWSHSMTLVGYDNSYKIPYGIILNSWGDVHGRLKDFETDEALPVGVLRVRADVIVQMFGADDTWTYGKINGFPAQPLAKSLFKLI